MKVLAIWERPQSDIKYGGVFALLDNGEFLHISQETEYDGTDKNGNAKYKDIDDLKISPAFDNDKYDFPKAKFLIKHFGGVLVYESLILA